MLSECVFTLSDFHRMTADADVSDLVAMFFGADIYVTGTQLRRKSPGLLTLRVWCATSQGLRQWAH
jgi:hypothetical protein